MYAHTTHTLHISWNVYITQSIKEISSEHISPPFVLQHMLALPRMRSVRHHQTQRHWKAVTQSHLRRSQRVTYRSWLPTRVHCQMVLTPWRQSLSHLCSPNLRQIGQLRTMVGNVHC